MSQRFEELAEKFNTELDQQVERDAVVEGARARALGAMARPRSTNRPRWTVGIVAAAAVMLLSLWFARRGVSPQNDLTAREGGGATQSLNGRWIATSESSRTLAFSDGSMMRVDPRTNVRITATGAHRVTVQLERGRSSFEIRHHSTTQWVVEAGPFRVHVVGTRFVVRWSADQQEMRLSLLEGQVRVDGGLLEAQLVSAGQQLVVNAASRTSTLSDLQEERQASQQPSPSQGASVDASLNDDSSVVQTAVDASAEPRTIGSSGPRWQVLARAAHYREALDVVHRAGVRATLDRASVDDLLLFARAARLAGEADEARTALRRLLARQVRGPASYAAMFELGRITADIDRDYPAALRWFEQAARGDPSGNWAEEAQGRAIECARRSGQRDRARELATTYLQRWPSGAFAAFARAAGGSP